MKCCNYPHQQSRSHRKEKAFCQHKKEQGVEGAVYNWVDGIFTMNHC